MISNSDAHAQFLSENAASTEQMQQSAEMRNLTQAWINCAAGFRYTYLFTSLGRPIIQFPQDMVAVHELLWRVRPDLVIETGIAHGGSLIHSASMLALLDLCDAMESNEMLDPKVSRRKVLGIDIDIRAHNRAAIEAHPMNSRIQMIQASSVEVETVEQVRAIASNYSRILVCLDSNHTHEHVLAELEAYAPLVSPDSYCVVFDTVVEDMPKTMFPNRPWGPGNNPKTAVWEYLHRLNGAEHVGADGKALKFEIDHSIESKLAITVAPDGYLRRVNP